MSSVPYADHTTVQSLTPNHHLSWAGPADAWALLCLERTFPCSQPSPQIFSHQQRLWTWASPCLNLVQGCLNASCFNDVVQKLDLVNCKNTCRLSIGPASWSCSGTLCNQKDHFIYIGTLCLNRYTSVPATCTILRHWWSFYLFITGCSCGHKRGRDSEIHTLFCRFKVHMFNCILSVNINIQYVFNYTYSTISW